MFAFFTTVLRISGKLTKLCSARGQTRCQGCVQGIQEGGKLCYLHKKVYKGTAGTGNRVHASWFYVDDIRYFKSLKSSKFSQNCVIHKCVISKYTRALNLVPLLNHHAKGRTFFFIKHTFYIFH